eukprot:TRINITY_DN3951_c0_g1_i3.p1 TRINITY_DN3951_c0_g1~~TRINITY_DN3951_c0_g1_i3.p1  ORF type:complete len:101 (-),score=16.75 TRINITY_DN3951_c0_g1_i3:280-582(-)
MFQQSAACVLIKRVRCDQFLTHKHVSTGYYEFLSPASQKSLHHQGGPFTREEAERWKCQEGASRALKLRRYDDLGKDKDKQLVALEHFRPFLLLSLEPSF